MRKKIIEQEPVERKEKKTYRVILISPHLVVAESEEGHNVWFALDERFLNVKVNDQILLET